MKHIFTLALSILFIQAFSQTPSLLKNVMPDDYYDSNPRAYFCFNDKLYFSTFNPSTFVSGTKLYKSNGTAAGTTEYIPGALIITPINNKLFISTPSGLYLVNGQTTTQQLIFNDNNKPWKYWDSETGGYTELNGKIYFYASDQNNAAGQELWVTDLTVQGTYMVKDINPGTGYSFPRNFKAFNGKMYFSATTDLGEELWVTDGTEQGTYIVKDINPGSNSSYPQEFVEMNGKLYFAASSTANNGATPYELWVTDGTEQGTYKIKYTGSHIPFKGAAVYNNLLYFAGSDSINSSQLWTSDGTENGTGLFYIINPNGDASPSKFIEYNGRLYFFANGAPPHNRQLWYTEGQWGTTAPVLHPGQNVDQPFLTPTSGICACNGSLFYTANYVELVGAEPYKLTTPYFTQTSINNMPAESILNLYPNPASNLLNIYTKLDKPILTVYNSSGSIIQSRIINRGNNVLDTDSWNNGLYFIHLQSANKTITQKLIISR